MIKSSPETNECGAQHTHCLHYLLLLPLLLFNPPLKNSYHQKPSERPHGRWGFSNSSSHSTSPIEASSEMSRKKIGKKLFSRTNSASCDFPESFAHAVSRLCERRCGALIKSRKLHPSERARDRNYILFIFHHIFPHFPRYHLIPPRAHCEDSSEMV